MSNRKKTKLNPEPPTPLAPPPIAQLPAIPTIYQMGNNLLSSLGSGLNLSGVGVQDMMLTSSQMSLSLSESPFLALTSQERELRKLLMASIKKPFKAESAGGKQPDEIDVRQAFKLKPPKDSSSPMSSPLPVVSASVSTNPIISVSHPVVAKAVEMVVSSEAVRAPEPEKSKAPAPPKAENPKPPKVKKVKVPKEKDESKVAKPKDKEEVARSNKEKEEKSLLRQKQLSHELVVAKYDQFFTQQSGDMRVLRGKCFHDSLLEEVQWLAIDVRQERRWKMAAHRSIAGACAEVRAAQSRALERQAEAELKPLKAISSAFASAVERFWARVDIYSEGVDCRGLRRCGDECVEETAVQRVDCAPVSDKALHEAIDEVLPMLIESLRQRRTSFSGAGTRLSAKQVESLNRVAQINDNGYGAILTGSAHSGKTSLCCHLVKEWLASLVEPAVCVLLVVPWFAIQLWFYRLAQLGVEVEIWHKRVELGARSGVLIVCSRDAVAFSHVLGGRRDLFGGALVDCREATVELVKSTSNAEVVHGASRWEEDHSWLQCVFRALDAGARRRCLVMTDLETCRADKAHLLAALVPAFFSYQETGTLARRCLDFMERLKVKCSVDPHINKCAEQTIVPILMTAMQKKKYASLLLRSEFDNVHDGLTLVKRCCFHEMLVPDYLLSLPDNAPVATGKAICPSFASVSLTLNRVPTFNISRVVDYRNFSGSGKMERLMSCLRDPANNQKRIVVVVSTDLELVLTRKYLLNYQIPHYYAALSPLAVCSLMNTQDVLKSFNNHPSNSTAVILVEEAIFSYPYISPALVDLVFVLSLSWATGVSFNRCLRNKDKSHVSVYRFVAADTLEELLERKGGSFMHLQGYRIPDARIAPFLKAVPTFAFDSTKLLSNAPANLLEYVKETAAPPAPRGLGKGKGLFLDGLQSSQIQADNDDVDSGNAEWISRFYFDLEQAERKMSGKREGHAAHYGWPVLTVRQGVIEKDPRFPRLIVSCLLNSFRAAAVEAENPIACSPHSSIASKVSNSLFVEQFLHYKKPFSHSTFADDFSHNLNLAHREGALVDPFLYVCPLNGAAIKTQSVLSRRSRIETREFDVEFLSVPELVVAKPPPKKARGGTTKEKDPTKRKSSQTTDRVKKSAAVQQADSVETQSDREYQGLGLFDDFREFDVGFGGGLFDDGGFADIDASMDLDF